MSAPDDVLTRLQSAVSYTDEKGFCKLLETHDMDILGWCLSKDRTLFAQACGQGFSTAAQFFLDNCELHVDLLSEYEGRTALQWACLRGHSDIVERLLAVYQERDLGLQTETWHENSEFYSASLGGHEDVMRLLMVAFPDKVKDEDVCQVLMYAACVGGHLPMVRLWVRPSLDVNEPLRLVASLHDCEHRTPFQAACEGHHEEVAVMLMDHFKAEITQHLADKYPDFTANLVDNVYQPLRVIDDEQVQYDLASVNIHALHPTCVEYHLTVITHMDLSQNKLKQIPVCVPWAMKSLVCLDLSHNRLHRLLVPEHEQDIVCDSLEKVNISHNNLTHVCVELFQRPSLVDLDLSHNALRRLNQSHSSSQPLSPSDMTPVKWSCESLTTLNLSHNLLDVLPADSFKNCTALISLDLSYNRLCFLPSPSDCRLERLNVSHNQLERFPPSTEQYWSGSLTHLYINNNCLDQLNESILKLGTLLKLDASHNKIQHLAPAILWDCPSLEDLNLSHNRLGQSQQKSRKGSPMAPEFPSERLMEELRTLNLSNNGLTHVPVSICCIKNLAMLDLSNNPIKELPQELGNLGPCWDLKLEGLTLQKADQQEIVKSRRPLEVIEHMRKQLRKVQPCHALKVLVIGPQNKGKSTVIESLVRGNVNEVTLSQQCVTVTSATLKSPGGVKIHERADNDRPTLSLRIWELAGNPELVPLHPLLWSENCVFLLVWDMTEGVSGIGQWLSNIKSQLDKVSVVLVATFRDRIPAPEVQSRVDQFYNDINSLYGDDEDRVRLYPKEDRQKIFAHLSSVVFITRHMHKADVTELRRAVYRSAISLIKIVRPLEFVVGQLLPQSYLVIEKKIRQMATQFQQEGRPPYLTQTEFDDLLCSDPAADFDKFDDQLEALKVWKQMGSVLHYDVWAEGLGKLYFLDPDWVATMAAYVLMPGVAAPYRQTLSDVQQRLVSAGFPGNVFKPYLQLLKYFDIGTSLSDQESLLLPCLLPKNAPGLQLSSTTHGRKLLRFYAMPHVPRRLWSRLILGFLMSMDRFSQSCWQGLDMKKPQLTYWQEGLTIKYGRGSIVIESTVFLSSETASKQPGILISILTDSPTLGDLAVVGFVTDEIDSALLTIFPHYHDNNSLFGVYALCPVCFHEVEPCAGVIRGQSLHFALADCAGDLLHSDYAQCSRGNKVALEDLIPEFLMGDLPEKFHFHSDEVQLKEKLGGGAAGTVYRGVLFGDPVAVKEFYRSDFVPPAQSEERATIDSGTSTISSTTSGTSSTDSGLFLGSRPGEYGNFRDMADLVQQRRQDNMTGRNLKVCRAFSELRQEIVILSQLRHPCLISLLGVSIRPSLLVVLELAPFGSLRGVLDDRVKDRPFNKYRDRDRTFGIVLDKDLTFKIVYQVALGLEYLHKHKILYRDLKCDNILVCSVTTTDSVNVKISDYGISKFTTCQGMVGMVGTPGYMAPEIMDGQAYNEKVDIFSFSMVVYELLTGYPPFEKYGRLHQLHQLINSERRRPSLMDYNIVSNFPFLERLMEKMWAHDPDDRPSAMDVMRQMEDVGFLLQHSHLAKSADELEWSRNDSVCSIVESGLFCNVTCTWALNEASRASLALGRNICWVWESPSPSPADRRLCIYNLASGKLQIPSCKDSPGFPVTCMAQIGQHRWVGSKGGSEGSGQEPRMDIFPIRCVDSAKAKCKLDTLEGDPVAIIQDKNNPNKDKLGIGSEGLVYIGLSNGTIQIYKHQTKRRQTSNIMRNVPQTEWQRHKTLKVTSATSIQAMCLVPLQKELVVGCGHSLAILSTDTLRVVRRICPLKYLPASVRDKVDSVQDLVRNEHTLWCSFRNSPLVVEFEMCSWMVVKAYLIEADLEVYITTVRMNGGPVVVQECQACREMSPTPERFPRTNVTQGGSPEDSQRDGALPTPPPRPPSSTKPRFCASQSDVLEGCKMKPVTEEISDSDNVQMRSTCVARACSTNKNDIPSGAYEPVDPVACPPEQTSGDSNGKKTSNRKITLYAEVFSGSIEDPPPVPPRRAVKSEYPASSTPVAKPTLSKEKSQTLPNLSTSKTFAPASSRSSTLPQRRSLPSEHDGVHVQSMLCVKDTLWVGSSCGEILVIGIQETDPRADEAGNNHVHSKHPAFHRRSRLSLNLEAKQMCNLISVRMNADRESAGMHGKNRSGGIFTLVQARDLVVAIRNISRADETRDIAEIAVWEACSAERIISIRRYWQSLAALQGDRN